MSARIHGVSSRVEDEEGIVLYLLPDRLGTLPGLKAIS